MYENKYNHWEEQNEDRMFDSCRWQKQTDGNGEILFTVGWENLS